MRSVGLGIDALSATVGLRCRTEANSARAHRRSSFTLSFDTSAPARTHHATRSAIGGVGTHLDAKPSATHARGAPFLFAAWRTFTIPRLAEPGVTPHSKSEQSQKHNLKTTPRKRRLALVFALLLFAPHPAPLLGHGRVMSRTTARQQMLISSPPWRCSFATPLKPYPSERGSIHSVLLKMKAPPPAALGSGTWWGRRWTCRARSRSGAARSSRKFGSARFREQRKNSRGRAPS